MVITKRIVSYKKSFTLVELLIVIAIISLLIGALIPTLDRSLSSNRLSGDVEVMRSKIEETRLLSGSTTSNDEISGDEIAGTDKVGYYALYFPPNDWLNAPANPSPSLPYYAIVRISDPIRGVSADGYCPIDIAAQHAGLGKGNCLVERVNLSNGVDFVRSFSAEHRFIGFRVPQQEIVELYCETPCKSDRWRINSSPSFNRNTANPPGQINQTYVQLKYKNKTASIILEPFTAKMTVNYN